VRSGGLAWYCAPASPPGLCRETRSLWRVYCRAYNADLRIAKWDGECFRYRDGTPVKFLN